MSDRIRTAILLLSVACVVAGARGAHAQNRNDVWDFQDGIDGNEPRGDLLVASDGTLYGTASIGGTNANGTVYKIVPPPPGGSLGVLTTLWQFTGGNDGSFPTAGVTGDPASALYVTAAFDGDFGYGTVLQLLPPTKDHPWQGIPIYGFSGGADGGHPAGTLLSVAGILYGTASYGGAGKSGVVFSLTPPTDRSKHAPWIEQVLWSFTGGADGAAPVAGLIADPSGRLYGTTKAGGPAGVGTVFRLTPPTSGSQWALDVLWGFTGGGDGSSPTGTLAMDAQGQVYGTTLFGGLQDCPQPLYPYYGSHPGRTMFANDAPFIPPGGNGCGVVFSLAPPSGGGTPWQQTVLWQFSGPKGLDGGNPGGALLLHPNGSIYGISTDYANMFWGSVFKLTPATGGGAPWTETVNSTFDDHTKGFYPRGGVVLSPSGLLYNTLSVGGSTWQHVSVYGFGAVTSSMP